ncbi:MAG: hypothetical protein J0L69_15405 [Bacteroidetes bacterium]|nr:hypothetical protein [Bacteroidota bacterium]
MAQQFLFPEGILAEYIKDFHLSSVTHIRNITESIQNWINEIESGKLANQKEEEVKSRFILNFFGDVLGFNYGNSHKWSLREEKKSVTDGTKSDGALGTFFADGKNEIVKVVIEMKDATTDLDKAQARPDKQTPVEQAFTYASKSGGNCKWVIVSNMLETRIYDSLDQSKYQVYFLKELVNDGKLKELLYLFHKDRFVKENEISHTEKLYEYIKTLKPKDLKPLHIIDRIYMSLKRFQGLGFVDPNYLAAIPPFNILSDHVWHFEPWSLFTINPEINDLINGINVENGVVTITPEYQTEITNAKVENAQNKLKWIFSFLNWSIIHEISAVKDHVAVANRQKNVVNFSKRHIFSFIEGTEGVTKNINLLNNTECDCLICNYRNLEIGKFLNKLKAADGNEDHNTLEYAYAHYLAATNDFKKSYLILKAIEKATKGKQDKGVEYFLVKHNIKLLHNLMRDYRLADAKEIMNDIKSIDLDKVIYDEIEFDVEKEVKKYLVDIKEDVLVYKLQDEIDDILFRIQKLKKLYEDGGAQELGPHLYVILMQKYAILYTHVHKNYIFYDIFKRYKALSEKVFKGLVVSHDTPAFNLPEFSSFYLTEAILHVSPSNLKEIVKNTPNIRIQAGVIQQILTMLNNYTSSAFSVGMMGTLMENTLLTEQLNNTRFEYRFNDIFSNLFTILVRLPISKQEFSNSIPPLINFLKVEKTLGWNNMEALAYFIYKKGDLYESKDLMDILQIGINGHGYGLNKYAKIIQWIPLSLESFHPRFEINNDILIQSAILKCHQEGGSNVHYTEIVNLYKVSNSSGKALLQTAFENLLNQKFNYSLYEDLVKNTDYDHNRSNYFQQYIKEINAVRGNAYRYGELELTDVIFFDCIFIIYKKNIDFSKDELKLFTNLNQFETWILNPLQYDYKNFDAKWLIDVNIPVIIERIKNNKQVAEAIEQELKVRFHPELAKIKYKYFN